MGQTSQVLERIPRSYPGGLSYLGVTVKLLRYQSPTLTSKGMPRILSPCRQVVKQGTTREDRAKKEIAATITAEICVYKSSRYALWECL